MATRIPLVNTFSEESTTISIAKVLGLVLATCIIAPTVQAQEGDVGQDKKIEQASPVQEPAISLHGFRAIAIRPRFLPFPSFLGGVGSCRAIARNRPLP